MRFWTAQVVSALTYLHRHSIIYGDMKPTQPASRWPENVPFGECLVFFKHSYNYRLRSFIFHSFHTRQILFDFYAGGDQLKQFHHIVAYFGFVGSCAGYDNVLLDDQNFAHLTDFGLARWVPSTEPPLWSVQRLSGLPG